MCYLPPTFQLIETLIVRLSFTLACLCFLPFICLFVLDLGLYLARMVVRNSYELGRKLSEPDLSQLAKRSYNGCSTLYKVLFLRAYDSLQLRQKSATIFNLHNGGDRPKFELGEPQAAGSLTDDAEITTMSSISHS